jgi:hypothetical protein
MSEPLSSASMGLAAMIGNQASFTIAMTGLSARCVVFVQVEGDEVGCIGATGYGTDDPADREAACQIVGDVMEAVNELCRSLGIELIRTPGGLGPRREG